MLNNYLSTRMLKSFLIRKKFLLIISTVILFLVSIFYGCQKTEYDNPHDSSASATTWAPKNLNVEQTSLKTAILTWTQPDQRIDSFGIESKRGQAAWRIIGYADKSKTSFIDSTFVPDPKTLVEYRISAIAWQNKSFSDIRRITPSFVRPIIPNAQKDQGVRIKVTWIDTYVNEDSFKVEKRVNGGNWVLCADTIRANSTFYYDKTPELNASISYRLSAKAAGVYSDTTGTDKISTIIAPPTWFTVASLSQTSCRVDWKQGEDWTTGYKIDRQFGNNLWQDNWLKLDNTKTTFTDVNLPTDQNIKYRVSTIVNNSYSVPKEVLYGLATPDTITALNPSFTSIDLKTKILDEGGSTVTEWGIVYSSNPYPTTTDNKIISSTASNTVFSYSLGGLDNAKTYYFRSYAVNRRGESYGIQKIFKPAPFFLPQLDPSSASNITQTEAQLSSYIRKDGGASILESGFVISTNPGPTINDTRVKNTGNSTPDNGVYKLSGGVYNLQHATIYYIRSYAVNSVGLSYGAESSFKTNNYLLPWVSFGGVISTDATKITITGTLIDTGGDPTTVRGFVVGSTVNPTLNDKVWTDTSLYAHTQDLFTGYITGLNPNQTYHCRVYAQNTMGVVYGTDFTATTKNISAPIVDVINIDFLGYTSQFVSSSVIGYGGNDILEAGFVYSTNAVPTINDIKVLCPLNPPDYKLSATLSPLVDGGTYYVRSFARNSIGLTYGTVRMFTTYKIALPVIYGAWTQNATTTTSYVQCGVSSNGGDDLSENGIVWGDNPSPTILDNKLAIDIGRTSGTYYTLLTNLQPLHKYYARGYIKNIKGIVYSPDVTYTTLDYSIPHLDPMTVTGTTTTTISLKDYIGNDGGKPIIESGFVYSSTSGPTLNDNKIVTTGAINQAGAYVMVYTITGLTHMHTYYIRGFATNSLGTGFGPETMVVTPY